MSDRPLANAASRLIASAAIYGLECPEMRRAFVSHKHELIVYWSPKCACTTIAGWFAYGLFGREQDERVHARAWIDANGHILKDKELLSLPKHYHRVVFSREPLSRAISAFAERFIVNRAGPITRWDQTSNQAKQFYRRMEGRTQDAESFAGISFVEYLADVSTKIRDRGAKEPKLDHHWNTQTSFRWVADGETADRIYDIKEMTEALAELGGRYGIAAPPRNSNATRYGAGTGGNVSNVNSIALAQGETLPAPGQFVSDETIDLAATAFAIDYETFGYARPHAR